MLRDKDIREPLFHFLEETFGKIRIIEEKTMGKSRADIMMVTENSLIGIEIKSDADTYERLERQVKDYNKYFDYNIIAVGTTHGLHISEHVPDWWGIITVEEIDAQADLYYYRKIQENPKPVKLKKQLGFLWRPELAHIQEINGMAKYKQKSKAFVIDKILEKIEPELLKKQLCEELFQRDYNRIADEIANYKAQNTGKTVKKRRRRSYRRVHT